MPRKATLFDIADALGISTGTVHRALHNHPGVNENTRKRVLQVSDSLGYRPNLAARFLSQRKQFRISVNTLAGTTSYWDEVRGGISDAARSLGIDNVELELRTYPALEDGDEEAFNEALQAEVHGMIIYPSRPKSLRHWMRKATKAKVPVVCVSTDAPDADRLAVVSIDTMASGSLAADLLGRFCGGKGKIAATLSALSINEHAEKIHSFESTLAALHPHAKFLDPVEDHDVEAEAYEKCRKLFEAHPDLAGIYISTEASMPVLRAARDAGMLGKLSIIATDLFPKLVDEMRAGHIAATIYQRPRTQGRFAFQTLYNFLVEGRCEQPQVTLAPHLVMRGNLDFFLARHPLGARAKTAGAAAGKAHPQGEASVDPETDD
ncbi:MAG TPA: LacI family DNA-binding transcriptional regulator [Dongiaceae bacterium]|nr:LacI family DNA-binding transcriptional regulator [Dongiaceae bacterium]